MKKIRNLSKHEQQVCSLSLYYNNHMITSGSNNIYNHDVRIKNDLMNILNYGIGKVCGLKWSPDGKYLASGDTESLLNIWDISCINTPLFNLSDHTAAVKALSWAPWQTNLLLSGGGLIDKTIKFWNISTGKLIESIDTGSQVCSIQCSSNSKEFISSHGFNNNDIILWNYGKKLKMTELKQHTSRVLHTSISPCGKYITSMSTDNTLKIWNIFQNEILKNNKGKNNNKKSIMDSTIR